MIYEKSFIFFFYVGKQNSRFSIVSNKTNSSSQQNISVFCWWTSKIKNYLPIPDVLVKRKQLRTIIVTHCTRTHRTRRGIVYRLIKEGVKGRQCHGYNIIIYSFLTTANTE